MPIVEWKSESPRTPFAPNWNFPFYTEKVFTREECKEIGESILRKEKEIIHEFKDVTNDGGTGLGGDSLTAKFSKFSVWEWDEPWVNTLRDTVNRGCAAMGQYMHDEGLWDIGCGQVDGFNHREEIYYSQCWANVMRSGEQILPHWHSSYKDSFLGAHLTIAANRTGTYYSNSFNKQVVKGFANKPGEFYMFPNHLVHWTDKHDHPFERITVAMDILTEQGWEEHPDISIKPNYKMIT